jgi:predicted RNA-binding Zn-ribbon protein involved in translation (DUF1610 family)
MYVEIDAEKKMEILKEYWKEGNLSKIARRNNVNRRSIYKWEEIAIEGMQKALEESKPGKRHITVEQQNEKLKEQINILVNILQKYKDIQVFEERIFCPKCKSDKIRKNGKMLTRKGGLQQKYICNKCSFSIYATLKKTL